MATLFQATGGVIGTMQPSTTWAAPNGLFPTSDRNDSSAYSWASSTSTITLPSSGLADGYAFLWGFETEDSSNGRYNPQGRMTQASGTGTFAAASTGGYSRDNSEDRAYVSGWAFVDNPSASSTYQFQWRRDSDAPGTSDGTVRSYIQAIPLYYSDVGVYTSTSTTATGGTTVNQITGLTGTDGTNITISSNTVSVTGDNKRYLVLGSAYHQGIGNARTQRWFGLRVDGSKDDSAKGCMYYRNGNNADGGESFIRLLETDTATRTVDLFQYRGDGVAAGQGGADVDGNTTGSNSAHSLVVIELNDSAEVFSSTNGTNTQEFALAGPVDVTIAATSDIEFNDSASFTRSTDSAVNVEQDMDLFAFANVSHARESGSIGSGSRWTVHGEFTINGTEQTGVGFHGNFSRGNQSTTDCHGSSTNQAGFFAATTGQDFGVSNQELSGTEGGGGDIETQADWVGFGLINLDSLEASSDTNVSASVDALTLTEQQATITLDVNVNAGVDALTLTEQAATITRDINVNAGVDALTLTEHQASVTNPGDFVNKGQPKVLKWGMNYRNTFTVFPQRLVPVQDTVVSAGVDNLTLTEYSATIALDVNVSAGVDALTLTEYTATVAHDVNVAAAVDALTLTEHQASIANDVDVGAGVDSLTLTELSTTITVDTNVNASVDALTLTELGASIVYDVDVLAGTDALSLTEYQASISLGVNVDTNVDSLTLTTYQASIANDVGISAGVDALTLTEYPAAISTDVEVLAGVTALVLTEYAATITRDVNVNAGTDALTLTTYPASLTGDTNVFAGVDSLTLTEHQATITLDVSVNAGTDSLTLTEQPASIGNNVNVSAGTDALTVSTFQASVTTSSDTNVITNTAVLSLTEYRASIGISGGGFSSEASTREDETWIERFVEADMHERRKRKVA